MTSIPTTETTAAATPASTPAVTPASTTTTTTNAHDKKKHYQPVGVWSGRLIFNREARLPKGAVWMEVHNAPAPFAEDLQGRVVELGWDIEEEEDDDEGCSDSAGKSSKKNDKRPQLHCKNNPNLYDNKKELQEYVDFLTTDINFAKEATQSATKAGRIHPVRCNGLQNVGPLETLAGARLDNNMHVLLEPDSVRVVWDKTSSQDDVKLRILAPPIQVRGRDKCLARFLGPVSSTTTTTSSNSKAHKLAGDSDQKQKQNHDDNNDQDDEEATDEEEVSQEFTSRQTMPSSDNKHYLYKIQHYNRQTQSFDDGAIEMICIPKHAVNNRGLHVATPVGIEHSPVNEYGWYLYGHFQHTNDTHNDKQNDNDDNNTNDESEMFVVEAWEPRRALMVNNLTRAVHGLAADKQAVRDIIWKNARYKKGTIETFLLDPHESTDESEKDKQASVVQEWKEGEQYLVIHLFGGIGGDIVNEENFLGLIPGHFAFGNATIVRDWEFTNELQFRIIHRQVYAHNNGGIIAGPNLWASYCGDLERGWFGTRPISDIIVKLNCVSKTYEFGEGVKPICPLHEMIRELNEMGARYRSGDGDGSALVTSAHSCVQDSSQALYAALQESYRKFVDNPKVQEWRKEAPQDEQNRDIAKLATLYRDLDHFLTPYGIRRDWAMSAKGLHGTDKQTFWTTLVETIRSYGTVVPRRAHDKLAQIFLRHGAKLWFIRTNQIGGNDPHIYPLAPARAFHYADNRKDPEREPNMASCCGCY